MLIMLIIVNNYARLQIVKYGNDIRMMLYFILHYINAIISINYICRYI